MTLGSAPSEIHANLCKPFDTRVGLMIRFLLHELPREMMPGKISKVDAIYLRERLPEMCVVESVGVSRTELE